MKSYPFGIDEKNCTLLEYIDTSNNKSITKIICKNDVILNPVDSVLGKNATSTKKIRRIECGRNCKKISSSAFASATTLLELNTEPSFELTVENLAFSGCSSLSSIIIQSSAKIGTNAFQNVSNIKNIFVYGKMYSEKSEWSGGIQIGDSLTIISYNKNGNKCTRVADFNGLTSITGSSDPILAPTTSFDFTINDKTYTIKDVDELELQKEILNIGEHSFYGCTNLKKLTFKQKLTDKSKPFNISSTALKNCLNLEQIRFTDTNATIYTI